MKEHFSKARRLRLTALVVGGLLYGTTASAANLVSTIPSDYGNSEMGAVTGSRVTTEVDATPQAGVLQNLNRDPASFGFHQKGKSMLLLRQYTYSTTELENTLLIDPNSAGAAASVAGGKTEAVPNMHAAAASDEYIYLTGYDMGQIGVLRQAGNKLVENKRAVVNLKNDIKQYCGYNFTETFQNLDEDQHGETGKTYTGDPNLAQVHGEALLVEGRKLYVAASVNPLGGYDPYDDGFLMQYDIQDDGSLKFGSYTRISRNIDQGRLNKFNDQILISCIGGYQHYNGTGNTHHTAINVAKIDKNGKLTGTEQRRANLPANVKATDEDMRDIKVLPNGTAYVMTYNLSPAGSQINAHVYQTTVSNLLSEHPENWTEIVSVRNEEGWFGKLNAEYYTKRLWLELGDTLRAYTDGDDTEKYKWQAKDFSENKAFSRFNKITMIEPDWVYGNTASVVMALPPELGGGTTAAAANENAVWNNSAAINDTITTRQSWDADALVSIGTDKLGDKATNVLAAISGTDGRLLNINAKKNLLQLQVENTVGNPTGIYAKGTNVTVSASKGVNVITKGFAGGNSLTNAVQLDAMKNKAAQITINGPLNISMQGGFGGNGVAVQKSDRLGEKSYEANVASGIRINGDLKIAGERTDEWGIPLNRENVFSRFNNAGILTQVEKSNVTVTGDVDMTVYGNGVTTNAKDSSVRIAGGGSIQVPADMKYSYYALAAYQGAVSLNMGEEGTKPGNGKTLDKIADVKLDGDLFALPTGRLDVALMTDKSYLHGLVDNGGTANLYLQNGAKWLNEGRNDRYYQDDEDMGAGTMAAIKTRSGGTGGKFYNAQSRVTNFVGGATEAQRGIIYQKSSSPLTIDNYSGHTAAIYTHDAAAPTLFKGGDIVINKAAAGTENVFTLFTDGRGVTTDNQNSVLNALANKLTYKSFTESNLLGRLSIGESLTTSSIKGDITFGNEKGSYTGGTNPPQPPSTEQTKTEFTSQLTQKEVAEYKDANVEPTAGNYKFTKDTTIRRSSYDGIIAATTYPKQLLNVDASGHTLTLIGDGSNFILGMNNDSKDGIKITADTLKIDVKSSDGRAFGIRNNQDGSVVTIKGDLDIKAQSSMGAQGLVASRGAAIETDGLHVELNKDSADGWSVYNSNGSVAVNQNGAHEVVIDGNVRTNSEGMTRLSLTSSKSRLNGVFFRELPGGGIGGAEKGNILTLTNGAIWNNNDWNSSKSVLADVEFKGSSLKSFTGGNDAAHAGVIFQRNDKDITIDNYSGHTRVFYAHDAAAPTTIIGGALKIGKAAADSIITLTTDNSGLNTEAASGADKKLVDDTLNALANRLWYTAYTTGERNLSGKAEIAEGLTTSAASKRIENITFDGTTGQGIYTTAPPTPPIEEQTETRFEHRLRGNDKDTSFVAAHVKQADGTYRFTKDSIISYANRKDSGVGVIMPLQDVKIDASDRELTVEAKLAALPDGQKTAAIRNEGKQLDIKAGTLRLLADEDSKSMANYSWGILNSSGATNISGMTEIGVWGYNSNRAVEATEGTVTLEGLKAKTAAYTEAIALLTGSTGQIYVNAKDGSAGSHTVKLDGNVGAMGETSRINVAMVNKDSGVTGLAFGKGKINFWLQNGAVWNNEQYGGTVPDKENNQLGYDYDYTFAGSHLASLKGGSNASNGGVIFQKNDKDVSIDSYSGHTRVFYVHEAATPTTMIGGDFRIKNAAADSAITLTTDNTGLNTESTKAADKNLVSATLNALANKLWYTAYTTGERNLSGKAEIAEGLTTSAASKRIEDITFDGTTGQGSYVYTPQSEVTTDPIKESETLTYDRQALATQPNTKGNRIVSALYTDNTAYDKQHPMVVDMNGHSLHLEANSKNQIASAIHGGSNKSIRIVNSGEEKTLTIKASNTDTRAANGIQTEANAHIYIQGPVTIEDVHTKGYNATAIQTNGTIGSPSDVTIDGDLTVQSVRADRVDTKNKGADDGRNLAALKTTADESKITVKGNVDIQNIKGSVLKTIGADSVIDVGGGTISAAEDADHTKQYRTVHAEKGTVNINTPEGVSGSRKTNITGDMYVTREYGKKTVEYSGGQLVDFESKGVLNVSLTTADSSWTGAATYDVNRADFQKGGFTAHDVGQFNLTLQNGARWTNELKSSVTDKWLGSHLASLKGGSAASNAGVIFQKNDKDISIDNYSGHTRVFYAHEAATPTTMKGGDFRIKNAAADSAITLTTDSMGLNTESTKAADKNLVSATLNALANKLWYTAYTTNERNLTGKAEIAEGLTTSAASKRIEEITFSETSGQGSYVYTPAEDGQTKTVFTTRLRGVDSDQEYIDANVRQADGTYRFTKDSTIAYDTVTDTDAGAIAPAEDVNIDATGHVLTIDTNITLPAIEEAAAIKNDGKNINIKADTTNLFVNRNAATSAYRARGILNQSGTINISGMTEIGVTGSPSVRAVEAEAGSVTLEGLKALITPDEEATAILTGSTGRININAKDGIAGSNTVQINGNVGAMGEASRIDIALVNKDSYLNGLAFGKGKINLWLQDGAQWINNKYGRSVPDESENDFGKKYGYTYAGSHLASLTGGSDADHTGLIQQIADEGITIDNYSGYTRVFYAHEAATPTMMLGGDFRIKNAAAGSAITLTTDNTGLNTEATSGTDKELVDNTLNALANKLWYTAYTTGERNLAGKAEIAEGLTASAASKRIESITFDETTGQGRYGNITPPNPGNEQTKTVFTTRIFGTASDQEYADANVKQADGTYRFTKDSTINYDNSDANSAGVIMPQEDVDVDASDKTLIVRTNTEGGSEAAATAAIKNTGKQLQIKAGTLRLLANENEDRYPEYAWGILNESGITTISGMTEIKAVGYSSSRAVEATEGKVTLEGLNAKVAPNDDALALLAGSSGQIFVNAKDGAADSHIVKIDGNVGAMGAASRIDVAMVNQDSGLNGLAFGKGTVNFWLQNGAVWNNEKYGYSVPNKNHDGIGKEYDYTFAGSRLTSLKGGSDANHAGVIFQKDDKTITIDNYSGHTRVFYKHNGWRPTELEGGDLRIENAEAGSAITLATDSTGLKPESAKAAEKNLVSATLNALANKLWYTAYTTGERNLTGKAEIAEGLTTSAASKRIENITFDGTNGQGSYIYTPAVDPPQTKTEFTTRIFGTDSDQEYIDANVRLSDGTYHFTKDSSITYQNGSDMNRGAIKPNADVQIDAADRELTIKSGGRTASVKEAAAITNDGKTLEIKAKKLKLLVNDTTSAVPLQSAWGIRTTGGTTDISAMTEIEVDGTKESKAVHASGGTVSIAGLQAKTNAAAEDAAALYAQNDGRISVNVKDNGAGDNEVKLDGNIVSKDAASRVDVALRTETSYFKGLAHGDGEINLWFQKGAVWQNEKQGTTLPTGFAGSHVNRFNGGPVPDQAGVIFQKDDRNITIDNYHGYTKVFFAHDAATPTNIKGGDIVVKKALGGSSVTLITDNGGLNMEATAPIAEKNLVNATLDSLANKLWYTAYTTGERNLTGKVQIAEGLTTSAASKRLEDITFDAATGRGSYIYTPLIEPPASQTTTEFTTSITGQETHDAPYVNAGVRKTDGRYIFTKDSTITTGKDLIVAGAWMSNISAAISTVNQGKTLDIDLNGKNLAIKTTTDVSTTGISSIGRGSKVHIKNAGAISIDAESTNHGQTATLFVNAGGAIHIENGGDNLEDKVLKVRANGNAKTSVAVIKSMNGVTGVESNITIDGLVDVLADGDDKANGKGANEAVSAVASTIDIGGGTIRAVNGAWAAIRAYGEFVSANYGTVNFNVTKGADGLANGAGNNRAVLEGDIVTNGGMGTKGRVSVGLSTADSHWIGNYADTSGYGVTPGQLGAVNLFMKNGSYWKGFSNGSMKVEMSGDGTSWTGFNVGNNLQLKLSDGAIWHNAITQEQKDQGNNPAISRVKYFTGSGGFIDMTGTNRFLASSKSLSGAPVQTGSSAIEEKGLGETGDLTIDEFNGSTTMLYRHDAASPMTIYGGKLTIGKAAAGSLVRMVTDNIGLNTESTTAADKNLVSATLNALANKLWYTAYTTGERNLTGKAEIAEGLTTSSASKRVEDITFDSESGQGGYAYTPAVDPPPGTEQTKTEFTTRILGATDQEYVDARVKQADGTYRFTKDSTITYQNDTSANRGAIKPSEDVRIDAADRVLTIKSGGLADVKDGAAIANYGKNLEIKAKTLKLLVNDTTSVAPLQTAWGILSTGGTTNVSGMTEIEVAGTERSKAVQAYGGTVTLEGLRAKTNSASGNAATLDVQGDGRINVNVKDGAIGNAEVMLDGNIAARESGSRVDAALTSGTSYLKGLAFGVGTLNLWLQNGAAWYNQEYTTQPTGFSSRLTNLAGGSDAAHAGVIFQKNDKDITIDNYSGYTKVFYEHDAAAPTTMKGGDFRIKNAATGSAITLTTDSAGLNTESTTAADKNLVSATLNALANKLWYIAYTTGERNLTGKAEIAEGLTTSAASKRVENITFNETTGQGGYTYTPAVDPPQPPQPGQDEQTTTAFTTPITGDAAVDTDYVTAHVLKDDKYTFTKNSKITAATGIQAVQDKPVTVQAAGADLAIQATDYGVDAAANSKVAITGKHLAVDAGSRSIRAAAGAEVSIASGFDLKGAIENTGGSISLRDTGRTSSLKGDITQTGGGFGLKMQGVNSKLESKIVASDGLVDLSMEGAGATFTGSIRGSGSAREAGTGERRLTLEDKTIWNVTAPSNLTRLNAKQGSVINYLFSNDEGVNIENFKGAATVHYDGSATADGTLTLANTGKFRIRNVEGTGNALTIATDASAGSDAADEKVANSLAKQFEYVGDRNKIQDHRIQGLSLSALIADGMTSSSKRYNILMGADGTSESVTPFVSNVEYGDYETMVMQSTKGAMTSSAMVWRNEMNDLMKRMGDLRLSPQDMGGWVRFYKGRTSSDKDKASFRMNYTTIQAGYDWKAGKDWRVGIAGSYMKGSSTYATGSGDNKAGNFAVYGTWTGSRGQYVDLIAKVGRMANEFTASNAWGSVTARGDYHTWGESISAEYGRRFHTDGSFFFEPQVEFSLGRLNSADYDMTSNGYGTLHIKQSGITSAIGRLGIAFGQETARSTWFVKASLYHEFAGDMESTWEVTGYPTKYTRQEGKDTWIGLQLGGTVKLNDSLSLYGDFEKTFSGDIKTDWRVDAGLRWSF